MPYLTARPASLRALAVPPEAIRLKPTEVRFLANSTRPVLSDTLNKAEREGISPPESLYVTVRSPRPAVCGGVFWGGQSRISSHHHFRPHYPVPNPGRYSDPRRPHHRGPGPPGPPRSSPSTHTPGAPRGRRCRERTRVGEAPEAPRGRAGSSPSWPGAMGAGGGSGRSGDRGAHATCRRKRNVWGRSGSGSQARAGHVTLPAPPSRPAPPRSVPDSKLEPPR